MMTDDGKPEDDSRTQFITAQPKLMLQPGTCLTLNLEIGLLL
jgi:hypothetical protein